MCIQFQQPLFIDQNAKAGRGTEKIEMKIRHAFQEFHFQLNIIYSYFVDESSQPSNMIKDKIWRYKRIIESYFYLLHK